MTKSEITTIIVVTQSLQASVGRPCNYHIRADIEQQKSALRKIKRAAMPTHKPTQIAAHLILPNRTQRPADS